jgi:hypothetical protein
MNNNNQKEKLPRAIVIANNKKQKQINNILTLRDEMIKNSIDSTLIKKFMDEEYEKINKEYELKIEKATGEKKEIKVNSNKKNNPTSKDIKKKREKAVEFLLKNKSFLEEHGASKEYVKKYVEKQYQEINNYYNIENFKTENTDNSSDSDIEFNYEDVNFID